LQAGPKLKEYFVSLSGQHLLIPNRADAQPRGEFLKWHRTQVFRGDVDDTE
jgi:hypothetical protein